MIYRTRTSIDEEWRAKMLASELVESKAAVSVHIRKVDTVYAWEGEVYKDIEWEVEAITSCPSQVANLVKGMHPYDLPEMIIDKLNAPDKIEEWCIGWCEIVEEL